MRIKLGAVTAQDAIDAAAQGRNNAKVLTDYVDQPAESGFPGFGVIWDRVWGALPGILTPSSNIASTSPVMLPQAAESTVPLLIAAAVVGGVLLIAGKKRSRR